MHPGHVLGLLVDTVTTGHALAFHHGNQRIVLHPDACASGCSKRDCLFPSCDVGC